MNAVRPTRAYLGCLTGDMTGDTLWVRTSRRRPV